MTSRTTAVLLDVGGVFLLPSPSHIRDALAQIGHSVTADSDIDRAHYVASGVFPMDLTGHEFLGPYWNDYLEVYASTLEVPDEHISDAVEHLRNAYVAGALWSHVIEGSYEGLRELVATGVPVGIVSNSDGTIADRLRDMEILQVGPGGGVDVRCVVDSGSVGVEKPDPGIFEPALDILGLPPDGVWYVGDTPAFDIVGARRAGLTPILMDPYGVNDRFGVTRVRSLSEVAQMIVV